MTVGEKRNVGCEQARGEVIAIWDDDDWSGPNRLTDQVRRLEESGLALTGYRTMRFTDGAKWWLYRGDRDVALATSMMFRRPWWLHRKFGFEQVGQDESFWGDAVMAQQFTTVDDETNMYATIHPGNTSPRILADPHYRPAAARLTVIVPSRSDRNLGACVSAIRLQGETGRVMVMDDFDGSARFLHSDAGPIDWQKGEKPFVFARNCNLGIESACGDDVILLNDDALLRTPSGFTAMQRASEQHPEFGIIAATTNVTGYPDQLRKNVGLRETGMVAFLCVLIPRRTIERVGLLDEQFVHYGGEDMDYCRRVREAGLKVGVFDGCYVDHGSLNSTFRPGNGPGDIEPGLRLYEQKWGDRGPFCKSR